jgi:ABC-2 type transport system permease protein
MSSPMLTIAKREFRSYFDSPLAYVVICLSFFGLGAAFFNYHQFWQTGKASLGALYEDAAVGLSCLVIPVITMALLAEEKRSGTLEMLITLPVKDSDVILGKYLGALGLVFTLLGATLIYPIAMFWKPWSLGPLDWGPVWSAYLGLALFSAAAIAVGLLLSSVTKSQAIAFFVTFAILVTLWFVGLLSDGLGGSESGALQIVGTVAAYISTQQHLEGFTRGLVDTRDIVYFLSITGLSLVFAFRSLERRKWA